MMRCLVFFMFSLLSQVNFSSSFSSSSLSSSPSCFALFQFSKSFSIDSYASMNCDYFLGTTSYPKTASWKEGTDCCAWDGVECDSVTGHVITIDLSCSCLVGTLYSNSTLFQLHHLKRLNLAFNVFFGSQIPSEFGNFRTLEHLNLSSSLFSRTVPYEISQLSSLLSLDLSNGFIVPDGTTSYNTDLKLEAPVWRGLIGNLTKLRELSLNKVDMSSVRPSSLMNLSSSLASLSLHSCDLSGKIKDNILRFPNIQTLDLGWNWYLKGYFPMSNWSSSLRFLDLSHVIFSAELPDSIGTLKSLEYLSLFHCDLKGSIPAALGNLTQMARLDLSVNNFIGLLPSSIFNLTRLSYLDISTNQLIGPLPNHVNEFPNLTYLHLFNNFLNGTLPSWLFTLPSLASLDLNANELISQMDKFHYYQLESIDLSDNKLHGSIPRSISKLVNLRDISLSSNNFTGELEFDVFSKLTNLSTLDLSYNSLSLSINKNVSYAFPNLEKLLLSSCNISEFPNFSNTAKYLEYLDLSENRIHGQVPRWLWDDESSPLDYLNLSHNFLSSIKQLPQIGVIDLHSNMLKGPLPILPPSIEILLISNNKLNGEIPLLTCHASSLQILDLSHNNLKGMIPQCLGNFSYSLSVLNLRMNGFHGSIPTTFSKGKSLRNLNLNGNRLEGSLPRSLVNCTNLEILDIGNNRLNDTFPHWLGSLPELRVLVIRSNQFHGSIKNPKTKFPFPKLKILDLSHNQFNGFLPKNIVKNLRAMMDVNENQVGLNYMGVEYPLASMGEMYYHDSVNVTMKGSNTELAKIQTFFTTIDFSNNSFKGEMPQSIGKLKSLKGLNLSHNKLTGNIPPSLGNLSNLEWLDLSSNKLVGEIPRQLANLPWLEVLNLSQNQLIGPIPTGKQFNTFNNDSYLGNFGLCGFPLSKTCSNHDTHPPLPLPPPSTMHGEDDSLNVNGFTWKVVLLGYGCGVVFGMFLGYLVFKTRKPEWLVRMVELEQHIMLRRLKKNARKHNGRRN